MSEWNPLGNLFQSPDRPASRPSSSAGRECGVGMKLSTRLRFKGSISLCDADGVQQGLPGCKNQEVQLNDTLIEAGGVIVEGKTLEDVEKILKGEPGACPMPEPGGGTTTNLK